MVRFVFWRVSWKERLYFQHFILAFEILFSHGFCDNLISLSVYFFLLPSKSLSAYPFVLVFF